MDRCRSQGLASTQLLLLLDCYCYEVDNDILDDVEAFLDEIEGRLGEVSPGYTGGSPERSAADAPDLPDEEEEQVWSTLLHLDKDILGGPKRLRSISI